MDRTKTPSPVSRRRLPLSVWLGLLLLAATGVGAAVAMRLRADEGSRLAASPGQSTRTGLHPVAIAYVDVRNGVTPLYPLQPGRVAKILVEENVEVKAGQPLFQLDDTLARDQLAEAQIALDAAKKRLEQAPTLVKQHEQKVAGQKEAIQAAQNDVEAAKQLSEKAQRFFNSKLGSSKEDVQAAARVVEKAEAALRGEHAKLAALQAIDPTAAVALAELEVKAKETQLHKAKYALAEHTVVAPTAGMVLRSLISQGEVLGPNPRQPAMLFAPSGPRIIRAEVEQEFVSGVKVGQSASIQDDSTTRGHWTGKVTMISDWYTRRRSILLEPLQMNDVRTLEVLIELDPNQAPLRIGQRVRVKLDGLSE
jgi:multidrug resistance efflux pump